MFTDATLLLKYQKALQTGGDKVQSLNTNRFNNAISSHTYYTSDNIGTGRETNGNSMQI